jgi:hypothetical protein
MNGTASSGNGDLAAQLARHAQTTVLDLSDERHYALVHETWEAAGRTRERMPHLFDALERTRAVHRREGGPVALPGGGGLGGGGTATAAAGTRDTGASAGVAGAPGAGTPTAAPDQWEDVATIAGVSGLGFFRRGELIDAIGSAVYSVRDGCDYTGLTLQLLDGDSEQPLGPVAVLEDFAAGVYEPIQAFGPVASEDVPVGARFTSVAGTAQALVEQGAPPLTLLAQQTLLGLYPATPPRSTDPLQKSGRKVQYVMICLLRPGGDRADCDYGPYGSNEAAVPIKGQISYSAPILKPFTKENAGAGVSLLLRRTGGGIHYAIPGNVFERVFTVGADGRSLTWNMQPVRFGVPDPFANYETVDIVFKFGLTTTASPDTVWALVSSTVNTVDGPSTEKLLPLQFATGCLAAGTPVTLADGSLRAIEALRPGERLRGGPHGVTLTVCSTSSGPEPQPLVWLRTADGRELCASEGHPVLLAGEAPGPEMADARGGARARVAPGPGGIAAGPGGGAPGLGGIAPGLGGVADAGQAAVACELRVGDRLLSETGAQRIVALERRPYGGLVWNMKLGTPAELARLGATHGTFYAGGILVGDARMQTAEGERRNAPPPPQDVLTRLPREWHEDYHATLATRAAA